MNESGAEYTDRCGAGELPVRHPLPYGITWNWPRSAHTRSAWGVAHQAGSCTTTEGTLAHELRTAVTATAGPARTAPLACAITSLVLSLCSLRPGPGYAFVSIQNPALSIYLIFYHDPVAKKKKKMCLQLSSPYVKGQYSLRASICKWN